MSHRNLIHTPNVEASWIAISLAIPSYLIVLIGTSPLLQGGFYLTYLLGMYFLWQRRQHHNYSWMFIFTSLIFLTAWIVPNVMTKYSGRLESDMLSLPILIYHVLVLSVVILWARSWSTDQKNLTHSWRLCCQTLYLLLTPLVFLVIIEAIRIKLEFPNRVNPPNPFNYRHLIGEVLLMFCLAGIAMSSKWVKLVALLLTILGLSLIENRGGLLSVGIIIGLLLTVKILNKLNAKQILFAFGVALLLSFLLHEQIYKFLDYFFLLEHSSRGLGTGVTQRLPVWMETWQEIQRVPWTGVGFWVSPYPYGDHLNPGRAVHNIFLRLWVENGTALLAVVAIILMASAIQIERKKLHWHRMAFWSILAYYFFIPRHLTLNPLSILLYWTIVQALCLPSKKGGNK
ncbi:MAG: O-antigen ligase family protein [Flavobacteriaceae bacterium]